MSRPAPAPLSAEALQELLREMERVLGPSYPRKHVSGDRVENWMQQIRAALSAAPAQGTEPMKAAYFEGCEFGKDQGISVCKTSCCYDFEHGWEHSEAKRAAHGQTPEPNP